MILALIYIVAVSLVVAALTSWASNNLRNSAAFTSANSLQVAASNMAEVAIQYVRYNPLISTSQTEGVASPLVACWGSNDSLAQLPTFDGNQIAVWCSTTWNPLSKETRDVTFYACPSTVLAAACVQTGNTLLTVEVYFDDYPPPPAVSAPIQALCTVWCGEGMTIHKWIWGSSSSGTATGKASAISFSIEPSDTSVGVTTSSAVTVLDANGNPVAGDTVNLAVQSGPATLDPTSTLTAVTNTSGVASFTNLIPDDAGNYTLTAIDGTVSTTSTNFTVAKAANTISVNTTAPTNAVENGPTYTPSATASDGNPVVITSSTTSVCTISSGVVSFVGPGTCTLDFNDAGNANYQAALQQTQSFTVNGLPPTQVKVTLASTSPTANATTNDAVTLQLESSSGAPTTSTGTTTLTLSDANGGFFSSANNSTGSSTLSVSFTNGVGTQTVYFANESVGADTITAKNGSATWGTAPLTVVAGAPAQVTISPATATPTVSATTNDALTFRLEDQFGNPVTSVGTTIVTLSDANGGFFSATNNTSGSSTLNVSFASGVGTATAYFANNFAGTDTITAMNGGASWGTLVLTLQAGAASQVSIVMNPTNPYYSRKTNTSVTVQLEDQFGNAVAQGGVTLTLSSQNNGFFSPNYGASDFGRRATATPTLNVTTNASGVASGYYGDYYDYNDTVVATTLGGAQWGSVSFYVQ